MRLKQMVAVAAAAVLVGGCGCLDCVSQPHFDEYRQEIKADGDALDAWVASVHEWILWLNANMELICPDCDPPGLPPDPPPDGEWGGPS